MRNIKKRIHQLLNARYIRYPALMHSFLYPPKENATRLESNFTLSDDFLKRMCAAYCAAAPVTSNDIWQKLGAFSQRFQKALCDCDIEAVRRHLHSLFDEGSPLTGMAHTARFMKARGSYGKNHIGLRCRDTLLSLAEALAVRPVMSNLQTSTKDFMAETNGELAPLLLAVEEKLGHRLDPLPLGGPPVVTSQGRHLNPDAIRHGYVPFRLEELGLTKEEPVLEIGGGFGMVARYAHLRGFQDYTIVDLPFVCAIQAAYLATAFTEDTVCLFGEASGAPIRLLPSTSRKDLLGSYQLVLNVDSLPEIQEAGDYLELIAQRAQRFLSINQEAGNATSGYTQNIISQLCDADHRFSRVSRHLYWIEQGYVEELYRVQN